MTCSVDGCENYANIKKYQMCEKHYYRIRRNGTLELKDIKAKETIINSNGYIKDLDRIHPLADSTGYVYRHRKVVYDSNPLMICVHCGKSQTWETCHVDHLDDDILNNELSNLGVSCPLCNQKRGYEKIKKKQRNNYAIHEYKGEILCLSEWAERLNIPRTVLSWRLKHWQNKDDVFSKPLRFKCK